MKNNRTIKRLLCAALALVLMAALLPAVSPSAKAVPYAEAGTYYIRSKLGTYLDLKGSNTACGNNVWAYAGNGSNAQRWVLVDAGGGWFFIKNLLGNCYLDVQNGYRYSGNNVWSYTGNRTDAQRWRFDRVGDYYCIVSAYGYYLDVAGGSRASGTNVQIYDRNGSDAQKWSLISCSSNPPTNREYYLKSVSTGNWMTVEGNRQDIGSNVRVSKYANLQGQRWKLVDAGGGWYYIKSSLGNLYLDVSGARMICGGNVVGWSLHGGANQRWKLVYAGNGCYYIKSALADYYLIEYNSNVCIWKDTGDARELWQFGVK